jgi:hypothetical protein
VEIHAGMPSVFLPPDFWVNIMPFIVLVLGTVESMYFGDFANRLQGSIGNIIHYYDFCSDRDIMQKLPLHSKLWNKESVNKN